MTKVWQFPDGQYYVSSSTGIYENGGGSKQRATRVEYTHDIEKAKQFTEFAPFSARPKYLPDIVGGHWVDHKEPLIMTGEAIIKSAFHEWSDPSANIQRLSWSDYWHGALDDTEPKKRYKTDGEISYFEEVEG